MGRKSLLASAVVILVCLFSYFLFKDYSAKESKTRKKLENQITALREVDPCWNVTTAPDSINKINEIFKQHFYFLGRGKQCIAFGSYDGQYVLKFLLQKPLDTKRQFKKMPKVFPFTAVKEYKVKQRIKRKQELFYSLILSYHIAPEQTGTLYVHLNPTKKLFKSPFIVDMKDNPVAINVDATQFVLQKRARHIKPIIIDLMYEGRVEQAKERLDQVLMLLYECAKKGIIDADDGLIRNNNIGFLENRAIYIDTGKLRLEKDTLTRKDFLKDLKRLKPLYKWLQDYYPELGAHFEQKQKELIDSYDSQK